MLGTIAPLTALDQLRSKNMTSDHSADSRTNRGKTLAHVVWQAEAVARNFVATRPRLFQLALRLRAVLRGDTEQIRGELAPTQIYRGYSSAQAAMLRSLITQQARREPDRVVDGFGSRRCSSVCRSPPASISTG